MKDADGTEYVQISERQTKTSTRAEARNVRSIASKAFATPDLPRERDPVVVYKIYSEKRPECMNQPDSPFYLGLNHTKSTSGKCWYKVNPMGINKLNSLTKTMAEKADTVNPRLTNHSARKRMVQTFVTRIFLQDILCSCQDTEMCKVLIVIATFNSNNSNNRKLCKGILCDSTQSTLLKLKLSSLSNEQ